MQQQEMQSESSRQNEERSYDSGYEAPPSYSSDYDPGSYNQKIGGQGPQNNSDNLEYRKHLLNLRMGMAITSLALWIGFFLITLAILASNPSEILIQLFALIGMATFTIMVFFANLIINRKPV